MVALLADSVKQKVFVNQKGIVSRGWHEVEVEPFVIND